MRVNLLLGFSLRAILIASLHIRRKSSKREVSSSEATYLNWIAFVDLTLEYSRSLVKHPSTDKLTLMKDVVVYADDPRLAKAERPAIFNKELRRTSFSGPEEPLGCEKRRVSDEATSTEGPADSGPLGQSQSK